MPQQSNEVTPAPLQGESSPEHGVMPEQQQRSPTMPEYHRLRLASRNPTTVYPTPVDVPMKFPLHLETQDPTVSSVRTLSSPVPPGISRFPSSALPIQTPLHANASPTISLNTKRLPIVSLSEVPSSDNSVVQQSALACPSKSSTIGSNAQTFSTASNKKEHAPPSPPVTSVRSARPQTRSRPPATPAEHRSYNTRSRTPATAANPLAQKSDTSGLIGGNNLRADKKSAPLSPNDELPVPASPMSTLRRVASTRRDTTKPAVTTASHVSHTEPTAQSTAHTAASSTRRADVRIAAIFRRANLPVEFTVRNQTLTGILDSGANVNMMPYKTAEKLNLIQYPIVYELNQLLGSVSIKHAVKAKVTIGKYTEYVKFLLYDHPTTIILGLDIMLKFYLRFDYFELKQFDPSNAKWYTVQLFSRRKGNCAVRLVTSTLPEVATLIERNKIVFYEFNKRIGVIASEKCHIRLTTAIPITLRPYRTTPPAQHNMDVQVEDFLAKGLIAPSTSPYSFPVVMVDKKDEGKKTRLCVNYIKLNEVTLSEHFPLPHIEEMQDRFLGAKWFTTIDIASGFYHIEMAEEDKEKTAFSTINGHYHWNRMPFGLKNAPIVFQRVISNLLVKHQLNSFAINYIDDIIV